MASIGVTLSRSCPWTHHYSRESHNESLLSYKRKLDPCLGFAHLIFVSPLSSKQITKVWHHFLWQVTLNIWNYLNSSKFLIDLDDGEFFSPTMR